MKTFNQFLTEMGQAPSPAGWDNEELVNWWQWMTKQDMSPALLQKVYLALNKKYTT